MRLLLAAALAACAALLVALPTPRAEAVEIEWVFVPAEEPPNACDQQSQGCFGAVSYDYQIGKFEVTNAQYAEFLNAVDPMGMNTLGLYSPSMESQPNGGINDDGVVERSVYQVKTGFENKPVAFVTFYDALRFANWLHNGQGDGDTETGSYTLLGGTPEPSNAATVTPNEEIATVVVPSENEWYKAAYYDAQSMSYFDYPTRSDEQTTCEAPPGGDNSANCDGAVGNITDIGSYEFSASPYGTFDQGGNVWEWNEALVGSNRGLRGGSWLDTVFNLWASVRDSVDPSLTHVGGLGFRVATVPEPETWLLGMTALLVLTGLRRIQA